MTFQELKEAKTKELQAIGLQLDQFEKMQLAINLKIALGTVVRYTKGEENEIRNMQLAEEIINEAKKILDLKVI